MDDNQQISVMGIWDLRLQPMSLGGLVILAAEMIMQKNIHNAPSALLGIIGNESGDLCNENFQSKMPLLSIIKNIEGIDDSVRFFDNHIKFCEYLALHGDEYIIWPKTDGQSLINYQYGTTFATQEFYQKNKCIPYLNFKEKVQGWAIKFMRDHVLPRIPVVVHLKNKQGESGCSNADFDVWLAFMVSCHTQYEDIVFMIIGNNELDRRFFNLPNVIVTKEFGTSLVQELTLLNSAYMFMGMASGPATMSLFSEIPYMIYKNPGHDAQQMDLEIGTSDHFSFATSKQKMVRIVETPENLLANFQKLYIETNRQEWTNKIAQSMGLL